MEKMQAIFSAVWVDRQCILRPFNLKNEAIIVSNFTNASIFEVGLFGATDHSIKLGIKTWKITIS